MDFKANPFPQNLNNKYQKLKISQTAYTALCAAGAFAQLWHCLLQAKHPYCFRKEEEIRRREQKKGRKRREALEKKEGKQV